MDWTRHMTYVRHLWFDQGLIIFGWIITGLGVAGLVHTGHLNYVGAQHEFYLNLETAITKILIGFAFEIISYRLENRE